MGREIKFRAWDKVQNRIVDDVQNMYEDDVSGHYYGCFGAMLDSEYLVIMQYTGFYDEFGKEIYEGDILSLDDVGEEGYEYREGFDFQNRGVVVFENGRWELDLLEKDNSAIFQEMANCHEDFIGNFGCGKVIGNIYENPELMNS